MRNMRKRATLVGGLLVLLAFGLMTAATIAPKAGATQNKSLDNCPSPFNVPGYSCTFEPATVTTTSHTKIVVKKTVEEQIKQFETVNHVIASINEGPPTSGAGCIDPTTIASWKFHAGDTFKNTDRYHRYFLDRWQAGWEVCGWHMVKIGGQYWIVGTKANCHNRNIMIPVRHKLPKPTKQVLVFSSVKTFESTYERWATSTTSTVYTCTPPFTLTYVNGQAVCFIATQVPVTPTTPTTTGTTTTVHTTTTVTTPTTPTTTTTPVTHSTNVACTGPQEITGGGSVIVKCDASDDNGAPISLNAQSQDSNSQVTGINCYSQGGSPSCQGNGQFEFRVNGFNSTSNVVTTTVKVYATANGVNSNTQTMTFNVDPSSGGFGG